MQFLGLLSSGEVVTLNDDTEVEGLADNLALVPYIILLYNLDNDYSIENIKRTYIQQGMTNYIENMVKYTQWYKGNGFNEAQYEELIGEIENNLKLSTSK